MTGTSDLSKLQSLEDVANFVGRKHRFLRAILYGEGVQRYYHEFEISTKGGAEKHIAAPWGPLHSLQSDLLNLLRPFHSPRSMSHGFVPGRSVLTNARPHAGKRFVLNIDLDRFFPSCHFGRVRGLFMSRPFNAGANAATVLAQMCVLGDALPIGAPTSPLLADMICLRMDGELRHLASRNGCWYTRYADDMTFSTNRTRFPTALAEREIESGIVTLGTGLLTIIGANGFVVNENKTRLQGQGQRQEVTGITVNEKPNVKRRYIRRIRAMLHHWESEGLAAAQARFDGVDSKDRHPGSTPDFRRVLRGRIEWVRMVRGPDDRIVKTLLAQYENLESGRPRLEGITVGQPADDPESPIRILHLSDFHFQAKYEWDSSPMLRQLIEAVSKLSAPDVLVVTGDVAFSGKNQEYDLARNWLDRLLLESGLGRDQAVIVPGNHDVDRARVKGMSRSFHEEIQNSVGFDESIAEMLETDSSREAFFEKTAAYMDFASDFARQQGEYPFGVTRMTVRGTNVAFARAWSPLASFRDDEKGNLILGSIQTNALTATSADFNVALFHHPFDYLKDEDAPSRRQFEAWADLILHGHLHEEETHVKLNEESAVVVSAAGSAYQSSRYANSVSMIDCFVDSGNVEFRSIAWKSERRKWIESKDAYPASPDGVGRLSLRKNDP